MGIIKLVLGPQHPRIVQLTQDAAGEEVSSLGMWACALIKQTGPVNKARNLEVTWGEEHGNALSTPFHVRALPPILALPDVPHSQVSGSRRSLTQVTTSSERVIEYALIEYARSFCIVELRMLGGRSHNGK